MPTRLYLRLICSLWWIVRTRTKSAYAVDSEHMRWIASICGGQQAYAVDNEHRRLRQGMRELVTTKNLVPSVPCHAHLHWRPKPALQHCPIYRVPELTFLRPGADAQRPVLHTRYWRPMCLDATSCVLMPYGQTFNNPSHADYSHYQHRDASGYEQYFSCLLWI